MGLDGVWRDEESLGDRLVGASFGDKRQYLTFPRAETSPGFGEIVATGDRSWRVIASKNLQRALQLL